MIIKKELKNAEFEYNEETKSFLIIDNQEGGAVELNKVYAFAFMRFVVRMAQRNWLRSQGKGKPQPSENLIFEEITEDPDQLKLFEDEQI
tara:strand:- start:1643 stop:1912 length:270 start_codon:yes stop_codon:yes gene_type:complete